MDYKMFKARGGIPANKNVVSLIKESLAKDGIKINAPLRFIGFEAAPSTQFYLNGQTGSDLMEVPSGGYFITPFDGERGANIHYLSFKNNFNGLIYYII